MNKTGNVRVDGRAARTRGSSESKAGAPPPEGGTNKEVPPEAHGKVYDNIIPDVATIRLPKLAPSTSESASRGNTTEKRETVRRVSIFEPSFLNDGVVFLQLLNSSIQEKDSMRDIVFLLSHVFSQTYRAHYLFYHTKLEEPKQAEGGSGSASVISYGDEAASNNDFQSQLSKMKRRLSVQGKYDANALESKNRRNKALPNSYGYGRALGLQDAQDPRQERLDKILAQGPIVAVLDDKVRLHLLKSEAVGAVVRIPLRILYGNRDSDRSFGACVLDAGAHAMPFSSSGPHS